MVSHQRQRSPERDFPYAKVTFLTSQNSAEYFTLIIDRYYSTASQQNLPFIKSYFMSKEIVAWLASLQHLHTTMVCKSLPPPTPLPTNACSHCLWKHSCTRKNGNDIISHCSSLFMRLHEINSSIRDMVSFNFYLIQMKRNIRKQEKR